MANNNRQSIHFGTKYLYFLLAFQTFLHYVLPYLNSMFHLENYRIGSFLLPSNVRQTTKDIANLTMNSDSITLCCPGGGFAGFWFTLGQLYAMEQRGSMDLHFNDRGLMMPPPLGYDNVASIRRVAADLESVPNATHYEKDSIPFHQNTQKPIHYHCFSAGCLGVVSILQNYTFDQVFDMALSARLRWKRGEITRYQVVENFVDQLLSTQPSSSVNATSKNASMHPTATKISSSTLSRIHVITTKLNFHSTSVLEPVSTSPRNIDELKKLLLQTSFIPYVTGDGFWYKGVADTKDYGSDSTTSSASVPIEKHLDGAFSVSQHDKCHAELSLPLDSKLVKNALNIDLKREDAEILWQMGLNFDPPF